MEHAHETQILHRDLRPANVLVSESGVVKVADFGTSRFLEKSHATTVIGSPPYMAPEQFQGRAVLASDIYSVGVILYQMLTGTLPYFSPNPAQIERHGGAGPLHAARAAQQPDPPRDLRHRDEGASRPSCASATSARRSCSRTSPPRPTSTTRPPSSRTSASA